MKALVCFRRALALCVASVGGETAVVASEPAIAPAAAAAGAETAPVRQESLRVVRAYIAALNAWDLDTLRTLLAEDAVLEFPYPPGGIDARYEGRDRILEFTRQVSVNIPDGENLHDLRCDTLHGDPGAVICTYKSDMKIGTNAYRNDYITRWNVANGRITYFGEYFDPLRLVVAMGGRVEAPRGFEKPARDEAQP